MRAAVSFAPIRRAIVAQQAEQQARFEADRLGRFPDSWGAHVRHEFGERARASLPEANRWLDACADAARGRLDLSADDADIVEAAERAAHDGWHLIAGLRSAERVAHALARHCEAHGLAPATVEAQAPGPAIARMLDPVWWLRRMRRSHARRVEGAAIDAGLVHRRGWLYASDDTVRRRLQQRARNRKAVESALLESDSGERVSLAAAVDASPANPAIKNAEFMVRVRGLEEVAKREGHAAEFWTLTCPSSFHRMRQVEGGRVEPNPKWSGATPADAQRYLCGVWSRIRAAWARARVAAYGFRVAEPHHDGCPHWHMLLFFDPARAAQARDIFARYALAVDGAEAGAAEHRVAFKTIDPARGSAAGYIAKYLAKNISGHHVGDDDEAIEGVSAIDTVARCDAWAATWGIRQFQQIGGAPVGVWRELRRMRDAVVNPVIERVRMAADLAAFDQFVIGMGGAMLGRKARPIRLAKIEPLTAHEVWLSKWGQRDDYVPADPVMPVTRYGDRASPRAFGVKAMESIRLGLATMREWIPYRSRFAEWAISWGGGAHGYGEAAG